MACTKSTLTFWDDVAVIIVLLEPVQQNTYQHFGYNGVQQDAVMVVTAGSVPLALIYLSNQSIFKVLRYSFLIPYFGEERV